MCTAAPRPRMSAPKIVGLYTPISSVTSTTPAAARARLDRRDARVVDAVRAAQPQRAHLDREPALLQRIDHAEHQHQHERGHHEHRAAAAEPAAREAEPAARAERLRRRVAEGDCGCRPRWRRRLEVGVELHAGGGARVAERQRRTLRCRPCSAQWRSARVGNSCARRWAAGHPLMIVLAHGVVALLGLFGPHLPPPSAGRARPIIFSAAPAPALPRISLAGGRPANRASCSSRAPRRSG